MTRYYLVTLLEVDVSPILSKKRVDIILLRLILIRCFIRYIHFIEVWIH